MPGIEAIVDEHQRQALRNKWANEAFNPSEVKYTTEALGYEHTPVTYERVSAVFGEEAAKAWQDIRDAKTRYYKATEEKPTQTETTKSLQAELKEVKDKLAEYETKDGMGGAVVDMIRKILNTHNVPKAAFIDDHVMNAIIERNQARDDLAKMVENNLFPKEVPVVAKLVPYERLQTILLPTALILMIVGTVALILG